MNTMCLLRPRDVAEESGMGINQVYRACRDDEIPNIRIGRSYFIPSDWKERLLKGKPHNEPAAAAA